MRVRGTEDRKPNIINRENELDWEEKIKGLIVWDREVIMGERGS